MQGLPTQTGRSTKSQERAGKERRNLPHPGCAFRSRWASPAAEKPCAPERVRTDKAPEEGLPPAPASPVRTATEATRAAACTAKTVQAVAAAWKNELASTANARGLVQKTPPSKL